MVVVLGVVLVVVVVAVVYASWTILRSWLTLILEKTAPKAEQTGSRVALITPCTIWNQGN